MKLKLLVVILLIFQNNQGFGQWSCQEWLTPNTGARGQTLTTTISGTQFFGGFGSAPCSPSDVYLFQSSSATTIHASTLSIQNDSVRVSWNIPGNASIGAYDLYLDLYGYSPFGSCLNGPTNCVRPQAFGVGTSIISGVVYNDDNQDSVFNTIDRGLPNQRVLLLPDNVITLTNSNGEYSFFVDTGVHTIVVLNDLYFYPVNSDSIILNVGSSNIDSLDFALHSTGLIRDPHLGFWGRARCNTTQSYSLSYFSYSVYPVNAIIKIYHSPNTPFVNSSIPPDSIVGDTIYFSASNVNYGSGSLSMQFQIPATGNVLLFTGIIEFYDMGGVPISQGTIDLNQIVQCSFDPNDKTVNPAGVDVPHYTLMNEELFYTIHFQNTGNDTAYEVHIIDSLDANLDMSTLQIISSSHPLIIEENSNGVVDFIFHNIMLPDSFVDEPASNGYLSYTIRHLDPLPDYTVVTNTAYIYFDQNIPVKTDPTLNTFVFNLPVGITDPARQIEIAVYPNPFSESVTITNKDGKPFSHILTITDIEGRELIRESITSNNSVVDLHNLSSGVYIYKLLSNTDNLLYIGRLIKQ